MDFLMYLLPGIVIVLLIGKIYSLNASIKGLMSIIEEKDQLANDIADRESQRQAEFNYVLEQSVNLMNDLVTQIYSGGITVEGGGVDFKQDLAAIVHILRNTPRNYLSYEIGQFNHSSSEDSSFDGLKIFKERAVNINGMCYIELLVILRIMISQKVDLKSASALWSGSVSDVPKP